MDKMRFWILLIGIVIAVVNLVGGQVPEPRAARARCDFPNTAATVSYVATTLNISFIPQS